MTTTTKPQRRPAVPPSVKAKVNKLSGALEPWVSGIDLGFRKPYVKMTSHVLMRVEQNPTMEMKRKLRCG